MSPLGAAPALPHGAGGSPQGWVNGRGLDACRNEAALRLSRAVQSGTWQNCRALLEHCHRGWLRQSELPAGMEECWRSPDGASTLQQLLQCILDHYRRQDFAAALSRRWAPTHVKCAADRVTVWASTHISKLCRYQQASGNRAETSERDLHTSILGEPDGAQGSRGSPQANLVSRQSADHLSWRQTRCHSVHPTIMSIEPAA